MSNVDAFLDTISACEGTSGPDGYRALFGYTPTNGKIFNNGYLWHPNIRVPFTQTDGLRNYSTAAGRYQILYVTWTRLAAKLGLQMFAPEDQDAAAIQLIAEAGAIADVKEGRFSIAIDRCARTWASLPASTYPQPVRSYQFALNAFQQAGGVVA